MNHPKGGSPDMHDEAPDTLAEDERAEQDDKADSAAALRLPEVLTWIGEGKRLIAGASVAAAVLAAVVALLLPPIYTARTSLLPPGSQQQGASGAALAALGSLGGLAGGLGVKSPDEFYVALLRSDSLLRALDQRFNLKARYRAANFEALRKRLLKVVRVSSDKKSGVITLEVDDKDPQFAADLANAHGAEVARILGRLAVTEAQQRRVFFAQQLKETKENLVEAESRLRQVQESSGVIVLDKQAEALISGAAALRSRIAEREVQLRVLRSTTTAQNPDAQRLASEIAALRAELAKSDAREGGKPGSSVDIPVGRIPEASIEYVRARRELRLQETLLEAMVRQYELAKLDEAKEGPTLQQVDVAVPPDAKSRPARTLIVLGGTLAGLLASVLWVVARRYRASRLPGDPLQAQAWQAARRAWGMLA